MANSPVALESGSVPMLAVWRALADRGEPSIALIGRPDGPPVVGWVNRTALDLLGAQTGDLLGRTLEDLRPGPGAGWSGAAAELLGGLGGRRPASVRRHDDRTEPVEVEVIPVQLATGSSREPAAPPSARPDGRTGVVPAQGASAPRCWLVSLRPHTDPADGSAAALRAAEHRFHALADHAPIGILLSEAGLRLGYANGRLAQITGTDAAALLGTGWLDAVHAEDLPALYEALQSVLGGVATALTVRLTPTAQAQRYLQLRLAPTSTPQRSAGFVATAEDITDRRAWEEQIAYQAHHDPLTGLVNRQRLVEVLTGLLGSRRQRDHEFALIFCDLDGFKSVNDRFGHAAGDRVLIEVARRLLRTAREDDVVARVSGDEFALVLRGVATGRDCEIAATRQLAALQPAFVVEGTEVTLSASLGVALPGGHDGAESLLAAADAVMYDAKACAPGSYRLAPSGPDRDGAAGTAPGAPPAGDGGR